MPERLARVTVRTQNGDVTISWESRRVLLSLLAQEENTTEIRSSLEAVGASRPVELSVDQRTMLRDLFVDWMRDDVLFPEGWDDELFPEGTQRGLTDLFLALEKGDPYPGIVEGWAAGEGEPPGKTWTWEQWREKPTTSNHVHCEFCDTRFSELEFDDLREGWTSADPGGYERWVCAGCFEKVRGRLGLTVDGSVAEPNQRLA